MKESHGRSIFKSLTWRAVGTVANSTIVWIISGNIKQAIAFGGINVVVSFVLYWIHERVWLKIRFGRIS